MHTVYSVSYMQAKMPKVSHGSQLYNKWATNYSILFSIPKYVINAYILCDISPSIEVNYIVQKISFLVRI